MEKILIIEDEKNLRRSLALTLEMEGYNVVEANSGEEGLRKLDSEEIDVVVTDVRLPGMDGIQIIREVKSRRPDVEVLVMTAFGSIENAVEALQEGASDYITKPFKENEFRVRLQKALAQRRLKTRLRNLEIARQRQVGFENIVTVSAKMKKILAQVQSIASTDSTIFISGESGTGKELIASAIHQMSNRQGKPFVPVNCGAIPENLMESELFGHVKGSFTGASSDKIGLVEQADGGTLFLDEIGEATLGVQVRLLRFLENGELRRVGDPDVRHADVRLISATNRDLREAVQEGRFREDLFYRIHVIPIVLPPLRERPEDIPVLAQYFVQKYVERFGKPIKFISPEAIAKLLSYSWPGNVRELQNVIEYACTFATPPKILPEDLPEPLRGKEPTFGFLQNTENLSLADVEKQYILQVLKETNWHQKKACEVLKISKATLYRRLKEYGISPKELKGEQVSK